MKKLTHVKWIGANLPMIKVRRNDARLYLTKLELKHLRSEIDEFIAFYADDFSEEKISIDNIHDDDDFNAPFTPRSK